MIAKIIVCCILALLLHAQAQELSPDSGSPVSAEPMFESAPVSVSEVAWAQLTPEQLEKLDPFEFSRMNSTNLSDISDTTIVAISASQVAAIAAPACSGFRDAQFAAMQPPAFAGLTEQCILHITPLVWSQVSAQKLSNITDVAFHGFKNVSWIQLPPASMSLLKPTQALQLRHHTCGGFTADQIFQMPPTFMQQLSDECISLVPSGAWVGITADGIKAIQHKIQHLSLPDVVPEIPPTSWSKLTDNFARVCPYITGAQIPFFLPSVFENIPNSCCHSIAVDTWRAITPVQIAAMRLDAFAQELSYIRIIGLNNKTLAAISPTQWNALGAKHNSNVTELTIPEILRVVAVARTKYLNFENHQAMGYPDSFIKALKNAVDSAPASMRDQILVTTFPEPDNLGILREWNWMHSVFMAQGPKSGILPSHIHYFAKEQDLNRGYAPLAGFRRRFIPLFTDDAMQAMTPQLVQQFLPDSFASFSASQLKAMGVNISYASAEDVQQISPVIISELGYDTFKDLNASVVQSLTCSQVGRLDVDRIYDEYNKNKDDPLALSFKVAMERCTIWREPFYGLSLRSIILIASGGGCLLVAIIGGVVYWRYKKRGNRARAINDSDAMPLLDSARHY